MLKIILADNQAIFRAGIAKVLAVEDDLRIVAQAQSVEQMRTIIDKFRAAVLIFSGSLQPDLGTVCSAAKQAQTKLIVIAENNDSPEKYWRGGVQGTVSR